MCKNRKVDHAPISEPVALPFLAWGVAMSTLWKQGELNGSVGERPRYKRFFR